MSKATKAQNIAFVQKTYPRAGANSYIGFTCIYTNLRKDGVAVIGKGWGEAEAWADAAKKIKAAPRIKELKKQRAEINAKLAEYE